MKLPFWASLFTLIGLIVLCGLGTWQLQRLEWKNELIAQLDAQYALEPKAAPIPLTKSLDLTRAHIQGRYLDGPNILIKPRTWHGTPGAHVLRAFQPQNSKTPILINRGWLAINETPSDPPKGTIMLTGLFKKPAMDNIFVPMNIPDKNEWYRADLEQIATYLDIKPLAPVILYIEALQSQKPDSYPIAIGDKPVLKNNHQQYAIFWFTMAGVLAVIFILRFVLKRNA